MKKNYNLIKKPKSIFGEKKNNVEFAIMDIEKLGEENINRMKIDFMLEKNIEVIKKSFKDCSDVIYKDFLIGKDSVRCFCVYIDGLVDSAQINNNVLKNLMLYSRIPEVQDGILEKISIKSIKNNLISVGEVTEIMDIKGLSKYVLEGNFILLLEGNDVGISISLKGFERRAISESTVEPVIQGPLDCFIEDISVNTSLIRKRLKTLDLKFEKLEIGRLSRTVVKVCYISSIAEKQLVDEVMSRLGKIDIEKVIESGYIEQFIEDDGYSPFPQIQNTQRVDKTVLALAEGKVLIIVDGTPFVLIAPVVFVNFINSTEDYYVRGFFGTYIRFFRYIAFFMGIFATGMYVAITTYNQELIPFSLLLAMSTAMTEVPFPAIVEALLMEGTFELLREASLRMPRNIGQAVSLAGAIVIGQTAVQAGFASPALVIIIAVSAVASFSIPTVSMVRTIRVLRFPVIILGGVFGIFGITLGILLLLIHLVTLKSFGVSYMSPISPLNISAWKDSVINVPIWMSSKRPTYIQRKNIKKLNNIRGKK